MERNFKTSKSNSQPRKILQKFGFQAKEEEWKHEAKEIKEQKCFFRYKKVAKRGTVEKMILLTTKQAMQFRNSEKKTI